MLRWTWKAVRSRRATASWPNLSLVELAQGLAAAAKAEQRKAPDVGKNKAWDSHLLDVQSTAGRRPSWIDDRAAGSRGPGFRRLLPGHGRQRAAPARIPRQVPLVRLAHLIRPAESALAKEKDLVRTGASNSWR